MELKTMDINEMEATDCLFCGKELIPVPNYETIKFCVNNCLNTMSLDNIPERDQLGVPVSENEDYKHLYTKIKRALDSIDENNRTDHNTPQSELGQLFIEVLNDLEYFNRAIHSPYTTDFVKDVAYWTASLQEIKEYANLCTDRYIAIDEAANH